MSKLIRSNPLIIHKRIIGPVSLALATLATIITLLSDASGSPLKIDLESNISRTCDVVEINVLEGLFSGIIPDCLIVNVGPQSIDSNQIILDLTTEMFFPQTCVRNNIFCYSDDNYGWKSRQDDNPTWEQLHRRRVRDKEIVRKMVSELHPNSKISLAWKIPDLDEKCTVNSTIVVVRLYSGRDQAINYISNTAEDLKEYTELSHCNVSKVIFYHNYTGEINGR